VIQARGIEAPVIKAPVIKAPVIKAPVEAPVIEAEVIEAMQAKLFDELLELLSQDLPGVADIALTEANLAAETTRIQSLQVIGAVAESLIEKLVDEEIGALGEAWLREATREADDLAAVAAWLIEECMEDLISIAAETLERQSLSTSTKFPEASAEPAKSAEATKLSRQKVEDMTETSAKQDEKHSRLTVLAEIEGPIEAAGLKDTGSEAEEAKLHEKTQDSVQTEHASPEIGRDKEGKAKFTKDRARVSAANRRITPDNRGAHLKIPKSIEVEPSANLARKDDGVIVETISFADNPAESLEFPADSIDKSTAFPANSIEAAPPPEPPVNSFETEKRRMAKRLEKMRALNKPASSLKSQEDPAALVHNALITEFINEPWLAGLVQVQLNEEQRQADRRKQQSAKAISFDVPDEYVHIAFTPGIHSPNMYSHGSASLMSMSYVSEPPYDEHLEFVSLADSEGHPLISLHSIGEDEAFIHQVVKDYYSRLVDPCASTVLAYAELIQAEAELIAPCWYWVLVNNYIGGLALFSLAPSELSRVVEVVHFSTVLLPHYAPALTYFCEWLWRYDPCDEIRVKLYCGQTFPAEVETAFTQLNFRHKTQPSTRLRESSVHMMETDRPPGGRFEDDLSLEPL
jgi:hypothetical protein